MKNNNIENNAAATVKSTCCLCGKTLRSHKAGHNPFPVRPVAKFGATEGRCCEKCNTEIVEPFRAYIESEKNNPNPLQQFHKWSPTAPDQLARKSYDALHQFMRIHRFGPYEYLKNGYDAIPPARQRECSICGEKMLRKSDMHGAGATRPHKNEKGRVNYCCPSCHERYVKPLDAYIFTKTAIPVYSDAFVDEAEKIRQQIVTMSAEEMDDFIKKERILEKLKPEAIEVISKFFNR